LRICGQRGNREVKDALIRFARWLRARYEFPIRVPVYLRPEATLVTRSGETDIVTSFFAPFDTSVEPYIRIATGDYPDEKAAEGRDDALAGYLYGLAYQLVNYFDWLDEKERPERRVRERADRIVDRYAGCVDRP